MCRRQRITLRSETKPLPLFEGRRWVFAFLTSVILMCVKYNEKKPLPLSGRRRWVVVCSKVGPSVQKTLTDSPDGGDDEAIMITKEK